MTPIDFSHGVAIPDKVLVRQLDDEIIILDLASESYFGLDEVGTAMWNEMTNADSIEHAYQLLLEQYDVEPETLRADMQGLLHQLLEKRLLEVCVT